ncbi:MAG: diguanylate cyclase domain-containing protein [Nitriliruptoraceae bacterium]
MSTLSTPPHAAPLGRRQRARALAVFYAVGGLLGLSILALPGTEAANRPALMGLAGAALTIAAGLALLADRIGTRCCHLALAVSYVCIAFGQVSASGETASATFALLYVWTALHVALFFDRRAVIGHITGTLVVHVAALLWLGALLLHLPTVVIVLGTQLAAAAIITRLVDGLRRLSETDPLTGLGNRLTLDRALRQAIAVSARDPSKPVCVVALDLDGFKAYNDEHGHLAGDQLLHEAAERWSTHLRDTDTLTRIGGDEFLLVLLGSDADDARRIVQRLIARTPTGVACSAGIARWNGFESAQLLTERADRALYEAKQDGPVRGDDAADAEPEARAAS